jgi:hypothetical protein
VTGILRNYELSNIEAHPGCDWNGLFLTGSCRKLLAFALM